MTTIVTRTGLNRQLTWEDLDNNFQNLNNSKLESYTETDPIFSAWNKSSGIVITKSQISDFGNYEPADATILKSSTIGVTVQGYSSNLTSWSSITPSSKQDVLVSGTNIKNINNQSILGSGNITISGGGSSGFEQTFLMMGC